MKPFAVPALRLSLDEQSEGRVSVRSSLGGFDSHTAGRWQDISPCYRPSWDWPLLWEDLQKSMITATLNPVTWFELFNNKTGRALAGVGVRG